MSRGGHTPLSSRSFSDDTQPPLPRGPARASRNLRHSSLLVPRAKLLPQRPASQLFNSVTAAAPGSCSSHPSLERNGPRGLNATVRQCQSGASWAADPQRGAPSSWSSASHSHGQEASRSWRQPGTAVKQVGKVGAVVVPGGGSLPLGLF